MIIRVVIGKHGGHTVNVHCGGCGEQVAMSAIKTKDPPMEMLIGEWRTEPCSDCEPPAIVKADAFAAERMAGFGYDHI